MKRALSIAFVVLAGAYASGCAFGTSAKDVFRSEGMFVVAYLDGQRLPVSGHLLAVDDRGDWIVDAVAIPSTSQRVVRIDARRVRGGGLYVPPSTLAWAVEGRPPPRGTRRIMRFPQDGPAPAPEVVRRWARFPFGMPPAALDALLARRGQTAVAPVPAP